MELGRICLSRPIKDQGFRRRVAADSIPFPDMLSDGRSLLASPPQRTGAGCLWELMNFDWQRR